MFQPHQTQDLQMDLSTLAGSLAHFIGGFQLDDSSVALIALIAGMVGGWRLTDWHDQLKAKRAKIAGKTHGVPRNQD